MRISQYASRRKSDLSKNIRQTVTFKATPHAVYEILMDSKKHAQFTGGEAKISRKAGGRFTIYGGEIAGENLELVPDQKIVQSWRYADWPEGVYSKATFALEAVEKGTRLIFSQSGVPDDKYEDIKQGWKDYYWEPMKAMLDE
jgi:activator of HSP90 ATPase